MEPAKLAQAVIDFYGDDPSRWTRGAFSRDADGRDTQSEFHGEPASWCILGCILKLNIETLDIDKLIRVLRVEGLSRYNDECASFEEFITPIRKIARGEL